MAYNFIVYISSCLLTSVILAGAMNSSKPHYISEDETKEFLRWDTLVPAIEKAMGDVSRNKVIQPARTFMPVPSKNGVLLSMPAYSDTENALGCKLVTSYSKNEEKGLPSVLATILFMDSDTGKVKAIIEGTEITTWRTVSASIAATKNIHKGDKKILAVIGAGIEGRMHSIGMKHYFNFDEIRIWNRTPERARRVCKELGPWCIPYENRETCIRGADVIVTATYSSESLVKKDWVKDGAHINAIGAGGGIHYKELELDLYKSNNTAVYVDNMSSANAELKGLLDIGVKFTEVGQLVNRETVVPANTKITVFQSLGMAVEDVVAAKLVYELYLKTKIVGVQ